MFVCRAEASKRRYRESAEAEKDAKQEVTLTKATVARNAKKLKLLEAKEDTVQNYRHDTNRALMELEGAYAHTRQLEKKNEILTKKLDGVSAR